MSSELCMHSRVSVSPRLSLGRRACVQSFVAFVLALDTHGAAIQSPHPMEASFGHVPPVFGPPPTPDSLVNKAALAGL
eukprot:6860764-Prymnesium_polylepis.1